MNKHATKSQTRIDAAGVLHHIIVGGIERRKIYLDDEDRNSSLKRLGQVLPETQTHCFAWALIPNHAHLLLRRGLTPIINNYTRRKDCKRKGGLS